MQHIDSKHNSDMSAAMLHSIDNFCMNPYALACNCQTDATRVITTD